MAALISLTTWRTAIFTHHCLTHDLGMTARNTFPYFGPQLLLESLLTRMITMFTTVNLDANSSNETKTGLKGEGTQHCQKGVCTRYHIFLRAHDLTLSSP